MPSETALTVAQRHDPANYQRTIARRSKEQLPFDPAAAPPLPLLLDTTVYIDRLQQKMPTAITELIASRPVMHSSVALCELSISMGILNPNHSNTAQVVKAIDGALAAITMSSVLAPSSSAWIEAGMLGGILARTQGLAVAKAELNADQQCCQRGRRRELVNDALIYLTAIETNTLLISRNSKHMDILMQVKPSNNVLLYHVED